MPAPVQPIPEGFHTVTAYLTVPNSVEALAFYEKAFGAKQIMRMPGPDGQSTMHAEMKIGDSIIMLADENPQFGTKSPQTLGGSAGSLHLYVENVDSFVDRAVKAGCQLLYPLMNAFWGDRMGKLVDKFGHTWSVATHIEDVPPEEMDRRAAEWSQQFSQQS
jgi:PhnB protein